MRYCADCLVLLHSDLIAAWLSNTDIDVVIHLQVFDGKVRTQNDGSKFCLKDCVLSVSSQMESKVVSFYAVNV